MPKPTGNPHSQSVSEATEGRPRTATATLVVRPSPRRQDKRVVDIKAASQPRGAGGPLGWHPRRVVSGPGKGGAGAVEPAASRRRRRRRGDPGRVRRPRRGDPAAARRRGRSTRPGPASPRGARASGRPHDRRRGASHPGPARRARSRHSRESLLAACEARPLKRV
jgi:hypothetical protein